jgi:hypothetical protein
VRLLPASCWLLASILKMDAVRSTEVYVGELLPHYATSHPKKIITAVRKSYFHLKNIVTYRPTATQRIDKHVPEETESW